MFNTIQTYLKFGRHYCGIEHTSVNESIICTLLKRSKKQLEIDQTFHVSDPETLVDELPKGQHAFLIVNDTHVLSKTIESDHKDTLKLVHKAFPNINLEDFYYEVWPGQQKHVLSLCRKTHVEGLIKQYKDLGITVIGFSLGNTSVSVIESFIADKTIVTSNADIVRHNDTVSVEERRGTGFEHYNVNGLEVRNDWLLSFSGALQTALNNSDRQTNFESRIATLHDAFLQSRFFNQFLKFAALFILGALLINFLFFNHYFNKVNDLQQTSVINNTAKDQMISLNESVTKKQKLTEDMLNNSTSRSSFYINSIIEELPESILLSEIIYQPLQKRVKANKPIEIEQNSLLVSGQSSSSDTFSKWINTLESKPWVRTAEIVDYGDTSATRSTFSIKIIIDHE